MTPPLRHLVVRWMAWTALAALTGRGRQWLVLSLSAIERAPLRGAGSAGGISRLPSRPL